MIEKIRELLEDINPEVSNLESVESSLLAEGIIDSFDIISMIEQLEEKFDIEIEATDITAENFDSIASIAGLVESKVN